MRAWHYTWRALVTIGISLAATLILVWTQPARAITLLVYLPGIVVLEAWFGGGYGLASVLLSAAGSALYRIWYLPGQMSRPPSFYETLEEELILLLVGLFVVGLMKLIRRGQGREETGARQLAAVLENVSDAVLLFNREFRVAAMNPAAHLQLDRPGETLVGEQAEDLARRFVFGADVPARTPTLTLEQTSRAGIAVHLQGTVHDVSRNRKVQVLIHAIPWLDARGEVQGSVVVITDLSAIKDLQTRLLDSARQAAVGKMISGLSHDFNHSLDIVRRGLAVLELHEDASAEERRKYRAMIDHAAVEGSQIVRRMRDFLAGVQTVTTAVDMVRAAREAIDLARPLWRNRACLEVVEDLQPVPPVRGSFSDLQRVLLNLLINAIEALGTSPGHITVHSEADAEHVRVWVEDTGPGIPPEVQAQLFQAYFTTKPNGMGLGLYSSAEIARAHQGSLRVDNPSGHGARVTLELPIAAPQPASESGNLG